MDIEQLSAMGIKLFCYCRAVLVSCMRCCSHPATPQRCVPLEVLESLVCEINIPPVGAFSQSCLMLARLLLLLGTSYSVLSIRMD